MKILKIIGIIGLLTAAFCAHVASAQTLGAIRKALLEDADESQLEKFFESHENFRRVDPVLLSYGLKEFHKLSKQDTPKAAAHKRIIDACLVHLILREDAGDPAAKVMRLSHGVTLGDAGQFNELLQLANSGEPYASFILADHRQYMKMTEAQERLLSKDIQRFYENAANGGVAPAMSYLLSKALQENDYPTAKRYADNLLESFAGSYYPDSIFYRVWNYAAKLLGHDGFHKDEKEAIRILELAAELNRRPEQALLYLIYTEYSDESFRNAEAAERMKAKGVAYSERDFCYYLAQAYNTGKFYKYEPFNIKIDKAKSLEYLHRAAELRHNKGAYFAALRSLDPESTLESREIPKEVFLKADLEMQKSAIKYFELCKFSGNKSFNAVPYAAIYIIGAPELRDVAKGVEILEKQIDRFDSNTPLLSLYLLHSDGKFLPRDEAKMKECEVWAEKVFKANMPVFYGRLALAYNRDAGKTSVYDSYFVEKDLEKYSKYVLLSARKGNEWIIGDTYKKLTTEKKYAELKEFLSAINAKGALHYKIKYANAAADTEYFFEIMTPLVEENRIKELEPYALSNLVDFVVLTLQNQNPKMRASAEIERMLAKIEAEFSPPDERNFLGDLYFDVFCRLNWPREIYGIETVKNEKLAFEYLVKSADLDYTNALEHLMSVFMDGADGIAPDHRKVLEYAKKYYTGKKPLPNQSIMRNLVHLRDFKTDPKFLAELLELGAGKGDIYSLLLLSVLYEDGEFVKKDETKAESYKRKIAELKESRKDDYIKALYTIAWNSLLLDSIVLGNDRIIELFSDAAEHGSDNAINSLIKIYLDKSLHFDFQKLTLDTPIVNAVKKWRAACAEAQYTEKPPYPKELSDEFFRLVTKSDETYPRGIVGELYFCFRDGICGFEKDPEKAEALRVRIKDFPEGEGAVNKFEAEMFSYDHVFLKHDWARVINIIERGGNLSEENQSALNEIKRNLEWNRELVIKLDEILEKNSR